MNFGTVPILSHQAQAMPKNASTTSVLRTPRGLRQYRAEQHHRNIQAYAVTQVLGEALCIERVVSEYVTQRESSVLKWPRR